MSEASKEVFPELFEAFLYAAYEDFKKNHVKPQNLVIIIPDEDLNILIETIDKSKKLYNKK